MVRAEGGIRGTELGVEFSRVMFRCVLVEVLARHGRRCLPWLNGIVAFAAWFADERRLLLARDAAGVKPLYWTRTPAGFAFASELKALLTVPGVDLTPDITVKCLPLTNDAVVADSKVLPPVSNNDA